tara:strand:- start:506 stop:1738 length:1233 start_codon:yes stop_codon:yes gene_type:complete
MNFLKLKKIIIFLFFDIWFFLLASLIILLIRTVLYSLPIRFGRVRSDVIGNGFFNLDCYLGEKKISSKKFYDFFCFNKIIINKQFAIMAKRQLNIFWFVNYLEKMNKLIPGGSKNMVSPDDYRVSGYESGTDPTKIIQKTEQNIHFTKFENDKGESYLTKTGLKKNDKFVCLIVRSGSYKKKYFAEWNIDWSYHDYRNSEIKDYEEAINFLLNSGYWVFRMGKGESTPLKISNKKFIDYAYSDDRQDFLDIWLMANCNFCISSGTGLDDVSIAFRKPIVQVNQIPIGGMRSYYSNILYIFKKLKKKGEQTFLTTTEIIDLNLTHAFRTNNYKEANVEIINNSPQEIRSVTEEMHNKLVKEKAYDNNGEKNQKIFWEKIFSSKKFNTDGRWINEGCKIGSKFLTDNQFFLN